MRVVVNSKVIIDWVNQGNRLQGIHLNPWTKKNIDLVGTLVEINFLHIYRGFNLEVDNLLKAYFQEEEECISYKKSIMVN